VARGRSSLNLMAKYITIYIASLLSARLEKSWAATNVEAPQAGLEACRQQAKMGRGRKVT
jgi:hypothetical protein